MSQTNGQYQPAPRRRRGSARLVRRVEQILDRAARHACDRAAAVAREALDFVAPGLGWPVPPMALAHFSPGPDPVPIPAGTALWALGDDPAAGDVEFRTAGDATAWPLGLSADFDPLRRQITFRLSNRSGRPWDQLGLNALTIACVAGGSPQRSLRIVDALLDPEATATLQITAGGERRSVTVIGAWELGRQLLPPARPSLSGLSLLRELLVCPEAFAAFSVTGLGPLPDHAGELLLEVRSPRLTGLSTADGGARGGAMPFLLNVVPVVASRPFSATVLADVGTVFVPLRPDRGHRLLSVDAVSVRAADGGWRNLHPQYRLGGGGAGRGESGIPRQYAVVHPPVVGAGGSGEARARGGVYLHLLSPDLSPDDLARHAVHVTGTQAPAGTLGDIAARPFSTEVQAAVRLVVRPTPLRRSSGDPDAMLRRFLAAGNPLWQDDPAAAAGALRELVHLYGLAGWRRLKADRREHARQQLWVRQVGAAITELTACTTPVAVDGRLDLVLSLDDAGPVPPAVLGTVLASCLSWLTLGHPIRVTLRLASGRELRLAPRFQGTEVTDD